jgi:hypothetical protein
LLMLKDINMKVNGKMTNHMDGAIRWNVNEELVRFIIHWILFVKVFSCGDLHEGYYSNGGRHGWGKL